jgi:hypothetical protein
LTQLIDKKIISQGNYPGSIIGELYRYAENSMDIYSRNYIEYVENIRKKRYYIQISDFKIDLQADCQTNLKGDDLYAIEKEINALLRLKKIKLDFESLKSYLSKCFDRLRLKEKNILNDDKLLVNINRLLNLLVRYSHVDNGNIEAISELLRTYNLLDQESGIYPIYTIFKYLAKYTNGSPEKCRCIIDQLIYRDARSCADIGWNLSLASQKVKEFFGQFIVSAIAQADTFAEAVQLYELYAKGFEKESVTEFTEEHADKCCCGRHYQLVEQTKSIGQCLHRLIIIGTCAILAGCSQHRDGGPNVGSHQSGVLLFQVQAEHGVEDAFIHAVLNAEISLHEIVRFCLRVNLHGDAQ